MCSEDQQEPLAHFKQTTPAWHLIKRHLHSNQLQAPNTCSDAMPTICDQTTPTICDQAVSTTSIRPYPLPAIRPHPLLPFLPHSLPAIRPHPLLPFMPHSLPTIRPNPLPSISVVCALITAAIHQLIGRPHDDQALSTLVQWQIASQSLCVFPL